MKTVTLLPQRKTYHVNTIFCIGKNYALHAREMKSDVPGEPVVFLKPVTSLVKNGKEVILPKQSQDVHHEVEVVVLLGKGGKDISENKAMNHIAGIGLGLDITARDLQQKAKEKGWPWSVSKGFDTFAPVSDFLSLTQFKNLNDLEFELLVNEQSKQKGKVSDMVFSIPKLISYLSTIFTLQEGDLIFTGTPEGVGPIRYNDKLKALLGNELQLQVQVI